MSIERISPELHRLFLAILLITFVSGVVVLSTVSPTGLQAGRVITASEKKPSISVNAIPLIAKPGDEVTVTATAKDLSGTGLQKITLYIGNSLAKICDKPPVSPCSRSDTYAIGTHNFYATVSDSAGHSSRDPPAARGLGKGVKSFIVTNKENHAPTVTSLTVSQQPGIEGIPVSFSASAYDPDGDKMYYTIYYDITSKSPSAKNEGAIGMDEKNIGETKYFNPIGGAQTYTVRLVVRDRINENTKDVKTASKEIKVKVISP